MVGNQSGFAKSPTLHSYGDGAASPDKKVAPGRGGPPLRQPPPAPQSTGRHRWRWLLGIAAAVFLLGMVTQLIRQRTGAQLQWTHYKDPEGTFQVDFPAKEIRDISVKVDRDLTEMGISVKDRGYTASSKLGGFGVSVLDDVQKHRGGRTDLQFKESMLNGACDNARVKIEKWENRNRPAGLARRVSGHRSEKGTTACYIAEAYVLDGRAYSLAAIVHPTDEQNPAVERFFQSFRVQEFGRSVEQ